MDDALPAPKRQKLDDATSFDSIRIQNPVPWSTFRADLYLIVRESLESSELVRLPVHGTQLIIFPMFEAMLAGSWEKAREYIDMSTVDWDVTHWEKLLEFCYRRFGLQKLTLKSLSILWWNFSTNKKLSIEHTYLFTFLCGHGMDELLRIVEKDDSTGIPFKNASLNAKLCWTYSALCLETIRVLKPILLDNAETRTKLMCELLELVTTLYKHLGESHGVNPFDWPTQNQRNIFQWLLLMVALTPTDAGQEIWQKVMNALKSMDLSVNRLGEKNGYFKTASNRLTTLAQFTPCPMHCGVCDLGYSTKTREEIFWIHTSHAITHCDSWARTQEFLATGDTRDSTFENFKFYTTYKTKDSKSIVSLSFDSDECCYWENFWQIKSRSEPQLPHSEFIVICHSFQFVPK